MGQISANVSSAMVQSPVTISVHGRSFAATYPRICRASSPVERWNWASSVSPKEDAAT
jgi:hypothetical protein